MRVGLVALLFIASVARGDVFRILDDPREAAQARVDVIREAHSEVHALYFLARNDRITLAAVALLRDARRRGVGSVRLIVDANFHRIPKGVLAHLRDEGVQVRVYHPLTARHPSWMFRRMHEKVIVVDGVRYIAGGRNLAESYFGLARKKNYVDRDVYVEGPSAEEANRHFKSLWDSRDVADLDVHVSEAEKRRAAQTLDDALRDLVCEKFIDLGPPRDWAAGEKDVPAVRFLHDPIGSDGPHVADGFFELIESAQKSIVIESPYLVPSGALLDLLRKKLAQGVCVTFVTNSLRSTDGVLPQAAYFKYRRRLARAGVDLREYKGPDPLHAKSAVIDGKVVVIGSYNVDPRSQNLNTEVLCVTEDQDVARELLASIEIHLRNSWVVRSNGAPPPRGERYPGVSRAKSVRVWLARFLLPILERQL